MGEAMAMREAFRFHYGKTSTPKNRSEMDFATVNVDWRKSSAALRPKFPPEKAAIFAITRLNPRG